MKVTVVTKTGVNLGPTPCSSTHTNWPKEGAETGTQCTPTPLPAGRRTLRPFPPSQDQTGPYSQHNMPTWKARKVKGLAQSQTVLGGVCTEGHRTQSEHAKVAPTVAANSFRWNQLTVDVTGKDKEGYTKRGLISMSRKGRGAVIHSLVRVGEENMD